SDLFEAEAASVAQVKRQPENVEPPDGIGQRPTQHDSPDIRLAQQCEITTCTTAGRGSRCIAPEVNLRAFLLTEPGVRSEWMVNHKPGCEPDEAQHPRGGECVKPSKDGRN